MREGVSSASTDRLQPRNAHRLSVQLKRHVKRWPKIELITIAGIGRNRDMIVAEKLLAKYQHLFNLGIIISRHARGC